jgi:hypothetical protein
LILLNCEISEIGSLDESWAAYNQTPSVLPVEKLSPGTKEEVEAKSKLSDSAPMYFSELELKGVGNEVSFILTDCEEPCTLTVKVSVPSARLSEDNKTLKTACPLLPTVAVPLREPLATSAGLMPESVYGTEVPETIFVVESVKVTKEPSSTVVLFEASEYVRLALEVSLMTTEEVAPPAVTVKVSGPSVRLSEAMGIEMVACPFGPTVTVPFIAPPVISAVLTPERE